MDCIHCGRRLLGTWDMETEPSRMFAPSHSYLDEVHNNGRATAARGTGRLTSICVHQGTTENLEVASLPACRTHAVDVKQRSCIGELL